MKGAYKEDGDTLCGFRGRTRYNGFKLHHGICMVNIRKNLLTKSVVKHWDKLSRKVIESPSLEVYMSRLDKYLDEMRQKSD